MLFRIALAALLSAVVSASSFTPNGDVAANSALGQRMLSMATVVEPARHLEQQERDFTFVANYSIRYTGCASLVQLAQQGNNNNNNNDQGMLYTQQLVSFSLCPTDSCSNSKCTNGGEYVIGLEDFVNLYTEYKLNDQEWQCEYIRENCYCDNANDDQACENDCYTSNNMDSCIQIEGEEQFEVQRYLECQRE
jgi:hypothetical protein